MLGKVCLRQDLAEYRDRERGEKKCRSAGQHRIGKQCEKHVDRHIAPEDGRQRQIWISPQG
jgi:hypothetical protein